MSVNGNRVFYPPNKGIGLPGGTENTTAWGLLKLLVADLICTVSGRIDAPLGAERIRFDVINGIVMGGESLTGIGRGV